jgi:hypothetical protein
MKYTASLTLRIIFVCLLLSTFANSIVLAAEIGSTPVYSVIEISFTGPSYGPSQSPTKDVDFWVRFQHQGSATSYKIHGFWDGNGNGGTNGNVFKVRFCPTAAGTWTLAEVHSNRTELNGERQGDHVVATLPAANHGFWIVDTSSPGNRWYRRSDGSHQYIYGNTMYSFVSETYQDGKSNGSNVAKDVTGNAAYYNKLRFSPIGDLYPHPSDKPFFNSSGSQTADGNNSHRPNPQWFTERVDIAVQTGLKYDMIADLIMAGVDTRDARSSLTPSNNGGDPTPFLKYLVARYGSYPNTWFCIVNEFDHPSRNPVFNASQIKRFGSIINSFMAYPNPLSVHHRSNWNTDLNSNPSWNDHVIFQDKIKDLAETADQIKSNYSRGGSNKPVIDDELSYQGAGDGHSEGDTIESHLGAFLGGGYGSTGYKSGNKLGQYFAGNFNASSHSSSDNLLWIRQKIDANISFWNMAPVNLSSSIFSGTNSNFRAMQWAGNEYVLGTDSEQSDMRANLPSGTWTVRRYDVMAKNESTLSTNASGSFSFSSPSSRAVLFHFKKNGGGTPTPPPTTTFTIPLKKDWNLISLPIQPSDTDIADVLSGINGLYTVVYAWNGTSYEVYPANGTLPTLSKMVAGRGYWIFMNEATNLMVTGTQASSSVGLSQEWNLVGYNSTTPMSTSEALASTGGKVTAIYAYNADTDQYEAVQTMEPGRGYWMYATANTTWTLP